MAKEPIVFLGQKLLFFATCASLAACGFSPAYAPEGSGQEVRENIVVRQAESRVEFYFASRLETRIGRSSTPTYELNYYLTSLGVGSDSLSTRLVYKGMVTWTLTEVSTQTRVAGGQIRGAVARTTTASSVASYAGEGDAERRMATMLADKLVLQLLAANFPE
jgi:LPS-assembly lipoprotein